MAAEQLHQHHSNFAIPFPGEANLSTTAQRTLTRVQKHLGFGFFNLNAPAHVYMAMIRDVSISFNHPALPNLPEEALNKMKQTSLKTYGDEFIQDVTKAIEISDDELHKVGISPEVYRRWTHATAVLSLANRHSHDDGTVVDEGVGQMVWKLLETDTGNGSIAAITEHVAEGMPSKTHPTERNQYKHKLNLLLQQYVQGYVK